MIKEEFHKYEVPFTVKSTIDSTVVKVTSSVLDLFYGELHFEGEVIRVYTNNYSIGYTSNTWRLDVFEIYEDFQSKMKKSIRRKIEKEIRPY